MVHNHSIEAYHTGNRERFPKRAAEILAALQYLGRASDREVCRHLGFADMNAVRPRISELIRDGAVEEIGEARDPVTGRNVRIVAPVGRVRQLSLAMEAAS